MVVEGLIFAGGEHPESAVAALSVVEDLEVLEDRVGKLEACAPAATVQQLCLHSSPERLHHRVVVSVADTAIESASPAPLTRSLKAHEVKLGGFNRSSQRFVFGGIVDARRVLRRVCASRGSCVVCC